MERLRRHTRAWVAAIANRIQANAGPRTRAALAAGALTAAAGIGLVLAQSAGPTLDAYSYEDNFNDSTGLAVSGNSGFVQQSGVLQANAVTMTVVSACISLPQPAGSTFDGWLFADIKPLQMTNVVSSQARVETCAGAPLVSQNNIPSSGASLDMRSIPVSTTGVRLVFTATHSAAPGGPVLPAQLDYWRVFGAASGPSTLTLSTATSATVQPNQTIPISLNVASTGAITRNAVVTLSLTELNGLTAGSAAVAPDDGLAEDAEVDYGNGGGLQTYRTVQLYTAGNGPGGQTPSGATSGSTGVTTWSLGNLPAGFSGSIPVTMYVSPGMAYGKRFTIRARLSHGAAPLVPISGMASTMTRTGDSQQFTSNGVHGLNLASSSVVTTLGPGATGQYDYFYLNNTTSTSANSADPEQLVFTWNYSNATCVPIYRGWAKGGMTSQYTTQQLAAPAIGSPLNSPVSVRVDRLPYSVQSSAALYIYFDVPTSCGVGTSVTGTVTMTIGNPAVTRTVATTTHNISTNYCSAVTPYVHRQMENNTWRGSPWPAWPEYYVHGGALKNGDYFSTWSPYIGGGNRNHTVTSDRLYSLITVPAGLSFHGMSDRNYTTRIYKDSTGTAPVPGAPGFSATSDPPHAAWSPVTLNNVALTQTASGAGISASAPVGNITPFTATPNDANPSAVVPAGARLLFVKYNHNPAWVGPDYGNYVPQPLWRVADGSYGVTALAEGVAVNWVPFQTYVYETVSNPSGAYRTCGSGGGQPMYKESVSYPKVFGPWASKYSWAAGETIDFYMRIENTQYASAAVDGKWVMNFFAHRNRIDLANIVGWADGANVPAGGSLANITFTPPNPTACMAATSANDAACMAIWTVPPNTQIPNAWGIRDSTDQYRDNFIDSYVLRANVPILRTVPAGTVFGVTAEVRRNDLSAVGANNVVSTTRWAASNYASTTNITVLETPAISAAHTAPASWPSNSTFPYQFSVTNAGNAVSNGWYLLARLPVNGANGSQFTPDYGRALIDRGSGAVLVEASTSASCFTSPAAATWVNQPLQSTARSGYLSETVSPIAAGNYCVRIRRNPAGTLTFNAADTVNAAIDIGFSSNSANDSKSVSFRAAGGALATWGSSTDVAQIETSDALTQQASTVVTSSNKSVLPDFTRGGYMTWTLRYSNQSGSATSNLAVTDQIPSQLILQSVQTPLAAGQSCLDAGCAVVGAAGDGSGGQLRFNVATLAASDGVSGSGADEGSFVMTMRTKAGVADNTTISNCAITQPTVGIGSNNCFTVTSAHATVSLAQTIVPSQGGSPPIVYPNDVIRYQLTVTNASTSAQYLRVYDALPAQVAFVPGTLQVNGATASDSNFSASVLNYTSATAVSPGGSFVIRYDTRVSGSTLNLTDIFNTATVTQCTSPGDPATCRLAKDSNQVQARVNAISAISGRVFEDLNYGGGSGRSYASAIGVGRPGATVELYDGGGAFIQSTFTDTSGNYAFTGLGAGNWIVRVVNSTVTSSRSGYVAGLWPVQTFRTTAPAGSAVADTERVGGEDPRAQDAEANDGSQSLAALTTGSGLSMITPQSIAPLTIGTGSTSNIDFGFNFDTIVNVRNAGQGSLRQWLLNANALGGEGALAQSGLRKSLANADIPLPAGIEHSIFMIPSGSAVAGLRAGLPGQLTGGVAVFTPTSALPTLTSPNTSLDGSIQSALVGDSNTGLLGAGGTVGTAAVALSRIPAPEVQITGSNSILVGLSLNASAVTVRGLAIRGFGSNLNTDADLYSAGSDALIEMNLIGSSATAFADPGAGNRTGSTGLRSTGATAVIRNNLIGWTGELGLYITAGASTLVSGNEIRNVGARNNGSTGDGIAVSGGSVTISANLVTGAGAAGVDDASGGNTITDNSLTGNGAVGGAEPWGIWARGTSTIQRNLVSNSWGAGIQVTGQRNRISQNSFTGNGNLLSRTGTGPSNAIAIDLATPSSGVNINDGAVNAGQANNGIDRPVLSAVSLGNGQVRIDGYVGSAAGQSAFANVTVEIYKADPRGQGLTYAGNVTTGATGDLATWFTPLPGVSISIGDSVTAIAIDALGNTSEFAAAVLAVRNAYGTSGPAMWVDASDINGDFNASAQPALGTSVQQLTDKSGNGLHFTSQVGSQPVRASVNTFKQPVLRFTAAQWMRQTRDFAGPTTIIYVAAPSGASSNRLLTAISNNWLLGWWSGREDQYYANGWVSGPGTLNSALPRVYSSIVRGSGQNSEIYRNGVLIAANQGGVTSPNGLSINGGAYCECTAADLAEVIVFTRALSANERQAIENALATKWLNVQTISGRVIEDVNYGGGPGRSTATAMANGAAGRPNATVEQYLVSGGSATYLRSTTTDASGNYSFDAGIGNAYAIRVLGSSVTSSRTGSIAGLLPVLTSRVAWSSDTATGIADQVGGINPATTDTTAGVIGSILNTSTGVYNAGGTAQAFSLVTVGNVAPSGIDFAFNFNTVVNENGSGPGSFSQVITNANTLGGDASLTVAGRAAGIEHVIFMIPNGTTGGGGSLNLPAGGLRSSLNYFSGGVATLADTSPTVSSSLIIDARTQPGWTSTPIVEIAFAGWGNAIQLTGGSSTVAGFAIRGFGSGAAVYLSGGSGHTIAGNYLGLYPNGTTAGYNAYGVHLAAAGVNNVTIGGQTAADRNVLSGNYAGIFVNTAVTGLTVIGNYIGTQASGNAALANSIGLYFVSGSGAIIGGPSVAQRNIIAGNSSYGLYMSSHPNAVIRGNHFGLGADGSTVVGQPVYNLYLASSNGAMIGGSATADANIIRNASQHGILIASSSGTIRGNTIQNNAGDGVVVTGGTTVSIRANSIFANGQLGIDLADNGQSLNDGTRTAGNPNSLQDYPVLTGSTLSGNTLSVNGYVGSAAGQTTFANATVEIFTSDNDASGFGEGQTYLGSLTTDANGNFAGTLTVSGVTTSTRITATATDASGNTSEFGPTILINASVSGTVFEDLNYGGGPGRTLAAALANGGSRRAGARVELYSVSGTTATFHSATTTDASGNYALAGNCSPCAVRVVASSVSSSRSGYTAGRLPVPTLLTDGSAGGPASALTDRVGGTNPLASDPGNGSVGTTFSTATGVFSAGLSGTAQAFAVADFGAGPASAMDFGFNWNTVVNENASGAGSFSHVITNANTLGGDASLAVAGRSAGVEHVIFMIPNGTTGAGGSLNLPAGGLRSSLNYFSGGVATLPDTAPTVSASLVIDARTQPGWTSSPVVEIASAGNPNAIVLSAGTSTVGGLVIRGFSGGAALYLSGGSGHTIVGNYLGLYPNGITQGYNAYGVYVPGAGINGITVGGLTSADRNVISGNHVGVYVTGNVTGSTIIGNYIGTQASGNAALGNNYGLYISSGSGAVIGGSTLAHRNLVASNNTYGLVISAHANPIIRGNHFGLAANGSTVLGNPSTALYLSSATNTQIGGAAAADGNLIRNSGAFGIQMISSTGTIQGNTIQNNGRDGISVTGVSTVAIRANSIFGNTNEGIDLADNGLTANDALKSAGNPNLLMDYPVFISGTTSGDALAVAGYVGTAPGQGSFANATVEIFKSDNDASGFGEGQTYLGSTTTDAGGRFTATFALPGGVTLAAGERITATATDVAGNTSEFGPNLTVTAASAFQNGSFELGSPLLPAASAVTPSFGDLRITGWMVLASNIDWVSYWTATDGSNSLDLNGGAAGGIQQSFATVPGGQYTVTFDLSQNSGCGVATGTLSVQAAGTSQNYSTSSVMPTYSSRTFVFTATASVSTLAFQSTSASCGGPVIDNVRLSTVNTLSGTVFEDINYGGGAGRDKTTALASGGSGRAGARVEIYSASGTFLGFTTSDASGNWSYTANSLGSHTVRVVNSTVSSGRSGYVAGLLPVQTFRVQGTSGALSAVTDHVGGQTPSLTDAGDGSTTLAALTTASTTAQSVSVINVLSDTAGIDFGFNFNTIVNVNNSGQGSLRQWLANANALANTGLAITGQTAGKDVSIFMIASGNAVAGIRASAPSLLTAGRALITLSSGLAFGTGANAADTTLDGSTQTANVGDTLTGSLGGGSVGTGADGRVGTGDEVTLPAFARPEVELAGVSTLTLSGATRATVRSLAMNSTGGVLVTATGGTGLLVEDNLLGTDAAGTPAGSYSSGLITLSGVVYAAGEIAAQRNYAYAGAITSSTGAINIGGSTYATVTRNQIHAGGPSGYGVVAYGSNQTVSHNLITGNGSGFGIGVWYGPYTGQNFIENTISNWPGYAAIAAGPGTSNSTIARNVITGNVNGINISATVSGITISKNAIWSNTNPGIDLLGVAAANDGALITTAANQAIDSPVFTRASVGGSMLMVEGYIGSAASQSVFGGATVEVFKSDNDASGYGEGQTYLGSLTADADGNFSGVLSVPAGVSLTAGERITGTASSASIGTSEFGLNAVTRAAFVVNHNGDATDASPGDGLCQTATAGQCTLRAAIQEANAYAGSDTVLFALPSCPGAGCTIAPGSALPNITESVALEGRSQAGYSSAPIVELSGNAAGASVSGLTLAGANVTVRGLVVNRFSRYGITTTSAGNGAIVESNYIGTTASGNAPAGNAAAGVYVSAASNVRIGGSSAAARNIVSGNGPGNISDELTGGVVINSAGTGVVIAGNYIGLGADGLTSVANTKNGVAVSGGATVMVGGATSASRNIISTPASHGVAVPGNGNAVVTVRNNWIGLAADGTTLRANGVDGVVYWGGSNNGLVLDNVIAGAGRYNLWFFGGTGHVARSNLIGTDASGTLARGGSNHGIFVSNGGQAVVGGVGAGEGNLIANHGAAGIAVDIGSRGTIRGNMIRANTGLGIDLQGTTGVDVNDGVYTSGQGNDLIDQPVLTQTVRNGNALAVSGHVGSTANQAAFANAQVDLYLSDSDPSGYGEGGQYLGTVSTDAQGNFAGNIALTAAGQVAAVEGARVTATATDATGNTSEFSANATIIVAFIVNDNGDANDAVPGDGVCATSNPAICTLRAAIQEANAFPGTQNIRFALPNCPGAGCTIAPALAPPTITEPVVIDGQSQPGFNPANGNPIVVLNGASIATVSDGLTVTASDTTVRGLVINGFSTDGLYLNGSAHRGVIQGNWIGIDAAGAAAAPNGRFGIYIRLSNDVTVGGTTVLTRNVLSGNISDGLRNAGSANLVIQGNYIGTDPAGSVAIPNGRMGLYISSAGANANVIGGTAPGAGNVIGGNTSPGIRIDEGSHTIQGNYIGTNAAGTAAIGNGSYGLFINDPAGPQQIGGTTSAARNVISGNTSYGILIDGANSAGTQIQGNHIGTNAAGTAALPNTVGIRIATVATNITVGGSVGGAGNLISGNSAAGISIASGSNTVQGNFVGVNAAGTAALRNNAPAAANGGIYIAGGSGHLIGGTSAGARNLLSGNGGAGIWLAASAGTTIQGNWIGVDATGTAAIGNGRWGIVNNTSSTQIGGTAAGAGNLISGNQSGAGGIFVAGDANVIEGNRIGTNAAGSGFLANGSTGGIEIRSGSNNRIGGSSAASANLIAGNTGVGVAVNVGTGNQILGNSIYGNSSLGIDLGGGSGGSSIGVTVNDGTKNSANANAYMDYPVITAARSRGNQLTVAGYVGSAANQSLFANSRIEIFVSDSDPLGFGEGQTLLGFVTTDAQGNFDGTITLASAVMRAGTRLTATATDTSGNTSEFGPTFTAMSSDWLVNHNGDAVDANPGDGLCETATAGQCTLRAAIMEANAWAGTETIAFALPSCPGAGCTIALASNLPAVTQTVTLDASTQPGYSVTQPLVSLDGTALGASGQGLELGTGSDASTVRGFRFNNFGAGGTSSNGAIHLFNMNFAVIEGNWFGLNATGTAAGGGNRSGLQLRGSGTGHRIGGTSATQRNVIARSTQMGIYIWGPTSTQILGNYIGTNSTGTVAVANTYGIQVYDGASTVIGGVSGGAGNLISGNGFGVFVGTAGGSANPTGTQILGNSIGVQADGTSALPNTGPGVLVDGSVSNVVVGNSATGSGNLIAYNGSGGVAVTGAGGGPTIQGNRIFGNTGLGIDLARNGVSANDGTTSAAQPSNGIDFPIISAGGTDGVTLSAAGYVGSAAGQSVFGNVRVDFYASDGDSSGYGEGRIWLGNLTTASDGRFSGSMTLPTGALATGQPITATATDAAGNTSEFGPNFVTISLAALAPARLNAFDSTVAAGALSGPLTTKTAGTSFTASVIAIASDNTSLNTVYAGTVQIDWLYAADNSGADPGNGCRASWVNRGSAGTATFVSGGSGRVNVNLTPPSVGREWRLRLSTTSAGGTTVTSCSNDAFAVIPASFAITQMGDTDDSTAGTVRTLNNSAASGGVVHRAGRPFSLRAQARDTGGGLAAGYDGSPRLNLAACVLPASGCTIGTLSSGTLTGAAGLIASDALTYSEVGAIRVNLIDDTFAAVDTADTVLAARTITSSSYDVGRFVPDHYRLTIAQAGQLASAQNGCAAAGRGFTFVGQSFAWSSPPRVTIAAENFSNQPTRNWAGSLQRLAPATGVSRNLSASNTSGLSLTPTWAAMTLTDAGNGTAALAFSSLDRFLFARNAAAPVASFQPSIDVSIAVADTSESGVGGNGTVASVAAVNASNAAALAFDNGGYFHYGRLRLQNAFGDARQSISALIELQAYSANGWLRLDDDRGCVTIPQAAFGFSAGSGFLASNACAAPASAGVTTSRGRANVLLGKSPGNELGSAALAVNALASTEGVSCLGAPAVPGSPSSLNLPWLATSRGGGTGNQDSNPMARIVWGRLSREWISQRELY